MMHILQRKAPITGILNMEIATRKSTKPASCVAWSALTLCFCAMTKGAYAQTANVSDPVLADTAAPRTQTVTLALKLGLGETDNVFLTPTDTRAQTILLTGIEFGLQRTGSA